VITRRVAAFFIIVRGGKTARACSGRRHLDHKIILLKSLISRTGEK
ncbi:hypothetical protein TNCT_347651, partial [Trichonephila clavata]